MPGAWFPQGRWLPECGSPNEAGAVGRDRIAVQVAGGGVEQENPVFPLAALFLMQLCL